jgi:hypothetical protein
VEQCWFASALFEKILLHSIVGYLDTIFIVVDDNEVSTGPCQSIQVIGNFGMIKMIIFNGEGNCLSEFLDSKGPSGTNDPHKHPFNIFSLLGIIDAGEKAVVGLAEVAGKVLQYLSNTTVGLRTAQIVELEFHPKKPARVLVKDTG